MLVPEFAFVPVLVVVIPNCSCSQPMLKLEHGYGSVEEAVVTLGGCIEPEVAAR